MAEADEQLEAFDSDAFSPIEYVNRLFPSGAHWHSATPRTALTTLCTTTEPTLVGVEPLIQKLKVKIRRVDADILEAVRAQSSSGSQAKADLQSAMLAIQARKQPARPVCYGSRVRATAQELNGHIQEIKSKADQSEAMVQEICRDIKKLDYAKKHLTSTITALRRLGMLGAQGGLLRVWIALTHLPPASAPQCLRWTSWRTWPPASGTATRRTCLRRVRAEGLLLQRTLAPLIRETLSQAVNQLSAHFESYKDIPRIADVRSKCASIKARLRGSVFDDFARFGREGEEALYSGGELADACLVVDALEPHVREELVATLCSKELSAYAQIFSASAGEASHLDKTERRYAYVKRKMAEREAAWAVFPPTWRVGALIVAALCKLTRAQVGEMLDAQAGGDVQGVLQALHRSLEFERELDERFGGGRKGADSDNEEKEEEEESFAPQDEASAAALRRKYERQRRQREHEAAMGDRVGASAMESAAREAGRMSFRGAISSVFEPHLRGYVELEERQLTEGVEALLAAETWAAEPAVMAAADAPKVLASASQVFLNIKKVLKRGSGLTRGQTLFALSSVFQRVLKLFAQRLAARLPKEGGLAEGEERVVCFIVNTAEYCRDTCAPLGESLARLLDAPWGDKVAMGEVEEEFSALVTQALGCLAGGAEARLEPVLAAMARGRWGELEAVGDQSEYVSALQVALQAYVPPLGQLLSKNYFQFFCEKLAAAFAPRFYATIFRCRRFNEAGAQQLLLDTHAVKQLLLDVPAMGAPPQQAPEGFAQAPPPFVVPAGYAKLVSREMNRAEALLKVIQAPPEVVGAMFCQLLPDAGLNELKQVCELKGMKRQEAQALLEEAQAKGLGGGAQAQQPGKPSQGLSMPSLRLGGGLAGLSELGSGLREGLGDLRVGLADKSLPDLKAFKTAFSSSSDADSKHGEAFRNAGRNLGKMSAFIKEGLREAQEGLASASLPSMSRAASGGVGGAEAEPAAADKLKASLADVRKLFS